MRSFNYSIRNQNELAICRYKPILIRKILKLLFKGENDRVH